MLNICRFVNNCKQRERKEKDERGNRPAYYYV